jgi:hypothetical protein
LHDEFPAEARPAAPPGGVHNKLSLKTESRAEFFNFHSSANFGVFVQNGSFAQSRGSRVPMLEKAFQFQRELIEFHAGTAACWGDLGFL